MYLSSSAVLLLYAPQKPKARGLTLIGAFISLAGGEESRGGGGGGAKIAMSSFTPKNY